MSRRDTALGFLSWLNDCNFSKFVNHSPFLTDQCKIILLDASDIHAPGNWWNGVVDGKYRVDSHFDKQRDSLDSSAKKIDTYIDNELKKSGLAVKDVVMVGLSQGGAMANYLAMSRIRDGLPAYGGLVSLSARLPDHAFFNTEAFQDKAHKTPESERCRLLAIHGSLDRLVKYEFGKMSFDVMAKRTGMPAECPAHVQP